MTLSLVICTRNRASQLRAGLDSLLRLESPFPWQLVVVDNGSTDGTQAVIADFRARFPQELVAVVEPKPGTGAARNRGWMTARGDIVAFIDDDCYPAPDFLVAVRQCFEEDPRLGFLAGRILLHDPTDAPITLRRQTTREEYAPGEFIAVGLFQTANCAFRRAALDAVDGFDERFGPGALFICEDADVVTRISGAGWPGAFDPRPLVHHHHGRKPGDDVARLTRLYDRGRGAFYVKCALNPALRPVYLRQWYWHMRVQPLVRTWRELVAGAEFFIRNALGGSGQRPQRDR